MLLGRINTSSADDGNTLCCNPNAVQYAARTWRSKRPGRMSAGSRMSARLVAAITMMPVLPSKPSISVSSWLSVCTRGGLRCQRLAGRRSLCVTRPVRDVPRRTPSTTRLANAKQRMTDSTQQSQDSHKHSARTRAPARADRKHRHDAYITHNRTGRAHLLAQTWHMREFA